MLLKGQGTMGMPKTPCFLSSLTTKLTKCISTPSTLWGMAQEKREMLSKGHARHFLGMRTANPMNELNTKADKVRWIVE